ncbi:MAG: phytoene/squalene synthase family protein [Candidatus Woesearchaeota archaeon]
MTSKKTIFKRGSTTYYNSSIFFPKDIRRDVFSLYAFVRVADDLVDSVPQQKKEFFDFKKNTFLSLDKNLSIKSNYLYKDIIVDFSELFFRRKFRRSWVEAFFSAMERDLKKVRFNSLKETEDYIYGSAEVIGLFMAKIMGLEKSAYKKAMLLGKAMQYINFIRDIKEDLERGRVYLPLNDAKKCGIEKFDLYYLENNPELFSNFIKIQLSRFYEFDKSARIGFKYIPKKYLVPIKTAQDMYFWTAKEIENNPLIVLSKKVKPKKHKVIITIFKNYFGGVS